MGGVNVANENPSDYQELLRQYDELRNKELELLKERHGADKALQELRFEIARIAARISNLNGTDKPCW